MDKDNFFAQSQIESNITHITKLINTGAFGAEVLRVFREPVFVSIILRLNDLLQKFNKLKHRIIFKDDISTENVDITELVRRTRNAIGHLDSSENMLDDEAQIKLVFMQITGKGTALDLNGIKYGADYKDDIAFYYGEYRIYLRRHIIRILEESKEIYKKLYNKEIGF